MLDAQVVAVERQVAPVQLARRAVAEVAYDGIPHRGELDADLVRPSRLQADVDERWHYYEQLAGVERSIANAPGAVVDPDGVAAEEVA